MKLGDDKNNLLPRSIPVGSYYSGDENTGVRRECLSHP